LHFRVFYSAVPGRYSDTSLHPLLYVYRLVLFERKLILLCYCIFNSSGKEFQNVGGNEKRYWVWSEVLCTCKDRHEFSQWLFAWPNHLQVQEWTTSKNWYKIQVSTHGFVWN